MENSKLTYIDLFSGCGGLSLGFYNSGWQGIFAIEKNKDAFSTLQYNLITNKKHFDWPLWLPQKEHDINELLKKYRTNLKSLQGKITLVSGGPPCQGFSMAGRRDPNDLRNKLIDAYIEFIKIIKPKLLFFENVKGFTVGFKNEKERNEAYSNYVKIKLEGLGYCINSEIIDFSSFGVPQKRNRFILVGVLNDKNNLSERFFKKIKHNKKKFLKNIGLNEFISLEDAISDLLQIHGEIDTPDRLKFKSGICSEAKSNFQKYVRKGKRQKGKTIDSHSYARHSSATITKFDYILKNAKRNLTVNKEIKKEFNLLKRTIVPLDPNSQTPTLTTLPDDYIHYCEPRILTVREYARIQTFPDWFNFLGKYTTGGKLRKIEVPRYSQIGNAIPPLFSEQGGIALKELLNE